MTMFRDFFDNFSAEYSTRITETLTFVTVRWAIAGESNLQVQAAIDNLQLIASRDTYELIIEAGESQLSINNEEEFDKASIQIFLSDTSDTEERIFNLKIKKVVSEKKISIYFTGHFVAYLASGPLTNVLETFADIFEDSLHFQVFEQITPFNTSSISFSNDENPAALTKLGSREEKLDALRDNANVAGLPTQMLPSDFFLIKKSDLSEFNDFFDGTSAIFSLAYLANSSELREDNKFSYKIYGYKAVICNNVSLSEVAPFAKNLAQIYSWAYEGGSIVDKLGLVRNVLSIHLNEAGALKIDNFVWEAIRSNYQIYLKGNIQSYLEVKNKLSELLFDSVARTSKLTDDVLDSLKNNIFVIVTFLVTVVVINGLKDSSFTSIFSTPYLLIAFFLAACSWFWMRMIREDTLFRHQGATDGMKEVLHSNYDKFLMPSEIDASLQPTLMRNKAHLDVQIKKYCRWWGIMTGLFLLLFVLGNIYFVQIEKTNTEVKEPKKDIVSQTTPLMDVKNQLSSTNSSLKSPNNKPESKKTIVEQKNIK